MTRRNVQKISSEQPQPICCREQHRLGPCGNFAAFVPLHNFMTKLHPKEMDVEVKEASGDSGSSTSHGVSHAVSNTTSAVSATAQEVQHKGPIQHFREGSASASVWANPVEVNGTTRTFYSVSFEHSYTDRRSGERKYARSFPPEDLGALLAVIQRSAEYLHGLQQPAKTSESDQAK